MVASLHMKTDRNDRTIEVFEIIWKILLEFLFPTLVAAAEF